MVLKIVAIDHYLCIPAAYFRALESSEMLSVSVCMFRHVELDCTFPLVLIYVVKQ
jgi:hypothetical protein